MSTRGPYADDSVGASGGANDGVDGGAYGGANGGVSEHRVKVIPGDALRGKRTRRRARLKQSSVSLDDELVGFPSFQSMRSILGFLFFPSLLAGAIVVTGGNWPPYILYPIALLLGGWVAFSTFRSMELIAVCIIFYLPFSKLYAIPIAPGVNATNVLILLGLSACFSKIYSRNKGWFKWMPGTLLVSAYGFYTSLSALTVLRIPDGWTFFVYNQLPYYKAWLDQFFVYFILLNAIRDRNTAKRMMVYMAISSMVVVLYTIPELLDKQGMSSIEKSRVGGPHDQSNNFGGFVAYTTLPLIAVFMVYMRSLKIWLLLPYLLIAAKILITSFSRAAYLAIALGSFLAAWFRGKIFLLIWGVLGIGALVIFPELLPESILARLQATTQEVSTSSSSPALDASSAKRLIMWKAAGDMIIESPILGKGFNGYQKLSSQYTEVRVEELSDPHNMYLYIASNMGLPALSLFLLILVRAYYFGYQLSKTKDDKFVRAIGISGAAATACYAVVGVFGTRMINLDFTIQFWTLFVVMQVLVTDQSIQNSDDLTRSNRKARRRAVSPISLSSETMKPESAETGESGSHPLHKTTRRKQRENRDDADRKVQESRALESNKKSRRTNAFLEKKLKGNKPDSD